MKIKDLNKKYAIAFVHIPTGEVGRTDYNFSHIAAVQMCEELDGICKTILHFPLAEGDDIQIKAKERQHA